MLKYILSLLFFSLMLSLSARSYYAEFRDKGKIVLFHGNIKDEDEAKVRVLQTQYLESLNIYSRKTQFESSLRALGVTVEEIKDNPAVSSENVRVYTRPNDTQSQMQTQTPMQTPQRVAPVAPSAPMAPVAPFNPYDPYVHEPIPPYPFDPPPNAPIPLHDPYFY